MYLALAVLTAVAIRLSSSDSIVRVAAAAWTTFNVFHLAYHLTMLDVYDTGEQTFLVISLVVLLVVSAPLLLPARPARSPRPPEAPDLPKPQTSRSPRPPEALDLPQP